MLAQGQQKKLHWLAWIVWLIAVSYFFYDYVQQVAPSVMTYAWSQSFHVDAASLGTIAAFYFYSYAILQIPIGLTVDHFGPHRPLVIAALISALGCLLLAMATSTSSAEIARLISGAGSGFSFVSCLKLVSNWFPEERFATLVGLTNLVGMLGAVEGEAPLAMAVKHLSWRDTMLMLAIAGAVLAIIILIVVRNHPPGQKSLAEQGKLTLGRHKIKNDTLCLTRNPQA